MTRTADLTAKEHEICFNILSQINPLLHKWSQKFPKIKFRKFKQGVIESPIALAAQLEDADKHQFLIDCDIIKQVMVPRDDLGGRSVENTVLEGFSKMALHFAYKWGKNNEHRGLTKDDYLQEGLMQIIESMYKWSPTAETSFSTYLYHSLFNRLNRVSNEQGSLLSHLTNDSLKLVSTYNKKLKELGGDNTFEEVVAKLGLNAKEIRNLKASLQRVNNQSSEDNQSASAWIDMSRATTISRGSVQDPAQLVETDEYMRKVIQMAKLSAIEMDLILSSMNPHYGWQSEVAERHLNAKGKPYHRMRVSQIYKGAKQKVQRAIQRLQAEE